MYTSYIYIYIYILYIYIYIYISIFELIYLNVSKFKVNNLFTSITFTY